MQVSDGAIVAVKNLSPSRASVLPSVASVRTSIASGLWETHAPGMGRHLQALEKDQCLVLFRLRVALDSGIPLHSFEKYLEQDVGATDFEKFGTVLHFKPGLMTNLLWGYTCVPLQLDIEKTNGIAHMWHLTLWIPDLAQKLPTAQRNRSTTWIPSPPVDNSQHEAAV